jgi:hypothetical protein
VFADFSGEVFRNVNVGALQESSLAKNLLLVAIVDQANLNKANIG